MNGKAIEKHCKWKTETERAGESERNAQSAMKPNNLNRKVDVLNLQCNDPAKRNTHSATRQHAPAHTHTHIHNSACHTAAMTHARLLCIFMWKMHACNWSVFGYIQRVCAILFTFRLELELDSDYIKANAFCEYIARILWWQRRGIRSPLGHIQWEHKNASHAFCFCCARANRAEPMPSKSCCFFRSFFLLFHTANGCISRMKERVCGWLNGGQINRIVVFFVVSCLLFYITILSE